MIFTVNVVAALPCGLYSIYDQVFAVLILQLKVIVKKRKEKKNSAL